MTWEEAQKSEMAWWGDCTNTLAVEIEQMDAAKRMGLDVDGSTIHTSGNLADLGGGPVSLLLKSTGWLVANVVDPGNFPSWVAERYAAAGIGVLRTTAEDYLAASLPPLDEVWIYNTLQHVQDPEAVVRGACKLAPVVRLFEWVGYETNDCHIHTLDASELDEWALSLSTAVVSDVEDTPDGQSYAAIYTRSV